MRGGADMADPPGVAAAFTVTAADGAVLPVYFRPGPPGAPGFLFGHANGFAAGSYGPWLDMLAQSAQVFAFDARGHGASRWPDGPPAEVFAIDRFGADLGRVAAAVAERLAGAPLVYGGHSLGGLAALRLALAVGSLPFRRTILFEPPVWPGRETTLYAEAFAVREVLPTGADRRRRDWPGWEAFRERLAASATFAGFDPSMLRAHAMAALRPQGTGMTLCCPSGIEASLYRLTAAADTWGHLPSIAPAFDIVSGDPALPGRDWITAVAGLVAARLPSARLTVVPGTGHMMIFERPDLCADLVRGRLAT